MAEVELHAEPESNNSDNRQSRRDMLYGQRLSPEEMGRVPTAVTNQRCCACALQDML